MAHCYFELCIHVLIFNVYFSLSNFGFCLQLYVFTDELHPVKDALLHSKSTFNNQVIAFHTVIDIVNSVPPISGSLL